MAFRSELFTSLPPNMRGSKIPADAPRRVPFDLARIHPVRRQVQSDRSATSAAMPGTQRSEDTIVKRGFRFGYSTRIHRTEGLFSATRHVGFPRLTIKAEAGHQSGIPSHAAAAEGGDPPKKGGEMPCWRRSRGRSR